MSLSKNIQKNKEFIVKNRLPILFPRELTKEEEKLSKKLSLEGFVRLWKKIHDPRG